MSSARYDVFISYNSRDRDAVHRIAALLRDRHSLRVWLDAWVLPPGQFWQDNIEEGLRSSAAVAVFVGQGGLGLWEKPEVRVALDRQLKARAPVIPVLLPGALLRDTGQARIDEVLPSFLGQLTAVVFDAALDDASALGRLVWGITGKNPLAEAVAALPIAPPKRTDEGDSAARTISEAILAGDVTFFLGRTAAGAPPPYQLGPSELSARLLRELAVIGEGYDGLVPGVDAVASLLAATRGEQWLEQYVGDILTRAGDPRPDVHTALAGLMKVLGRRPAARRARRRAPRLILTTNFDLLMERALLRAGLPFSRLVQFGGEPRIDVSVFADVALAAGGDVLVGGKKVRADSADELDDAVYSQKASSYRLNGAAAGAGNPLASLAIDQLPDPILYKFHGSQDIEKSCAISADQCFDFAWRLLKQECVPSQITEIIGSSTLIVLAASVLDHDFRLTYHTLLREQLKTNSNRHFAIQSRQDIDRRDPWRLVAERDWERVEESTLGNYRIKSIDAPPGEFLKQLSARIGREWGTA